MNGLIDQQVIWPHGKLPSIMKKAMADYATFHDNGVSGLKFRVLP